MPSYEAKMGVRDFKIIPQFILFIILTGPFGAHATECPKYTGVYNQRDGLVKSLMAFNITNEGRLFLVNRDTGSDGALLEMDGNIHSLVLSNGAVLKYVAGCDRGFLAIQGIIDGKKFAMTISDESGGIIVMNDIRGQVVYDRSMRGFLR
jgi:hypothetical protein